MYIYIYASHEKTEDRISKHIQRGSCIHVCALSVQICTVANGRMYLRMRKDVYNILQHISETCSVWEQQSPTFFRMEVSWLGDSGSASA